MAELEALRAELKNQQEQRDRMSKELEAAKLRAEIEMEKRKCQEMEVAQEKLDRARAESARKHQETLQIIKDTKTDQGDNTAVQYLKEQLAKLTGEQPAGNPTAPKENDDKPKQEEVTAKLKELMRQQQELVKTAQLAAHEYSHSPVIQALLQQMQGVEPVTKKEDDQALLMDQVLNALQGKQAESRISKQKDILKQFLVEANKTPTTGGATTLKPQLLKQLTGESDFFNMAEWLAQLNRHKSEEGCDACQEDCKQHKKSGMLGQSHYQHTAQGSMAAEEPLGGLGR